MEQKGETMGTITQKQRVYTEAFVTDIVSLFVDLDKPPKEEDPQNYAFVVIESSHKVSDHYILQEKLGMWVSQEAVCVMFFVFCFFFKTDFLLLVWARHKFPAEGIKICACSDICSSWAKDK